MKTLFKDLRAQLKNSLYDLEAKHLADVCHPADTEQDEALANAHLMTYAPEILDALAFVADVNHAANFHDGDALTCKSPSCVKARAVILKVIGKKAEER